MGIRPPGMPWAPRLGLRTVSVALRTLVPADLPAVRALNNGAVPAVPPMTEEEMAALVATSSMPLVAVDVEEPEEPLGFVLAMDPDVDYDGENFRWFVERGGDFVYVDRIVIGEAARGTGIGRLLYQAVFARAARDGRTEVDAEVNVRPANPQSLAFHARLGFVQVGERETKGGAYRVALVSAPVPAP
jgi:predicted GNAT superfamily acetyltransferase